MENSKLCFNLEDIVLYYKIHFIETCFTGFADYSCFRHVKCLQFKVFGPYLVHLYCSGNQFNLPHKSTSPSPENIKTNPLHP